MTDTVPTDALAMATPYPFGPQHQFRVPTPCTPLIFPVGARGKYENFALTCAARARMPVPRNGCAPLQYSHRQGQQGWPVSKQIVGPCCNGGKVEDDGTWLSVHRAANAGPEEMARLMLQRDRMRGGLTPSERPTLTLGPLSQRPRTMSPTRRRTRSKKQQHGRPTFT